MPDNDDYRHVGEWLAEQRGEAPDNDRAPATEDVEGLIEALSDAAVAYGEACASGYGTKRTEEECRAAGEAANVAYDRLAAAFRAEHERARKAEEALEVARNAHDAWVIFAEHLARCPECAEMFWTHCREGRELREKCKQFDPPGTLIGDDAIAARARESGGGA